MSKRPESAWMPRHNEFLACFDCRAMPHNSRSACGRHLYYIDPYFYSSTMLELWDAVCENGGNIIAALRRKKLG